MTKDKYLFAIGLITSLFFIWGLALNLNPILIPHLKKACQLTTFQSSFVDFAAYIAYFIFPIPAALFMKKFGYKGGIILGLILVSTGMFLFYPAADVRNFGFFLVALFVMFSGSAFLETAANPYITVLGKPEGAARRINLAQSFNGLATVSAGVIGRTFILSGITLSSSQESAMSPGQLNTYLNKEASSVQAPFLIIGAGVLIVAILIYRISLPAIVEEGEGQDLHEGKPFWQRMRDLFKEKELMAGVTAQFFYVGAQACVWGFFVLFAERVAGMDEKTASLYLIAGSICFMAGRFIGTLLMRVIDPIRLLTIYSLINVFLIALAVVLHGNFPVFALLGVDFFMSIMFPTIFSISIHGLGKKTKEGSSFVIMAIVGGAVCALVVGLVADLTNIQWAYAVPGLCFVYIFFYARKRIKIKELALTAAH
ncbi:MAG TPA: L-fucose:H+ symporter permease [Mucilaginibacter sp.]|jgi:FHS family L-fucose permease-like MFS transporter